MPQKYKRKEGAMARCFISPDILKRAVQRVVEDNVPLHAAAKEFGISRNTLRRHVRKIRAGETTDFTANYSSTNIFTAEEEAFLAEELQAFGRTVGRLTCRMVRKRAYDFAVEKSKKVPKSWEENGEAGYFWLRGFLERNNRVCCRVEVGDGKSAYLVIQEGE